MSTFADSPTTTGESDDSKAAQSAQAGKQAATEVAQTAAGKAQEVAGEAKQQVGNVLQQAQGQLKEQTQAQHQNAVSSLRSLGDELRSMADNSEGSGQATSLVSQAADRAHGAADWLDGREPGEILDEVRRYARRSPGTFILGALAAGIVAGRLTRGVAAVHSDDADASSGAHRDSETRSAGGAGQTTFESAPYATPGNAVGGGADPTVGYSS